MMYERKVQVPTYITGKVLIEHNISHDSQFAQFAQYHFSERID